jgi:hypothetical protein
MLSCTVFVKHEGFRDLDLTRRLAAWRRHVLEPVDE